MARILVFASLPSSLSNFRGPLLLTLIGNGNEVYAGAPFRKTSDNLNEALLSAGVKPIDIPLDRGTLNPLRDLRTLWASYKAMRATKVDWILGYTIKPVIWGNLAAKLARVPHRASLITGLGYAFTSQNNTKKRVFLQKALQVLYKLALSGSEVVFFQNRDDLETFKELGLLKKVKVARIVNGSGVDLNHFSETPIPPIRREIRFLLIARLLREKGIQEYIQAGRIIKKKFPDVQLHLVGDVDVNPGSLTLKEIIAWHESGDIVWHGHQQDVRSSLADCHVYVLPSYREGTPRSVLEAMATGRPIITTDAPGCRETVKDGLNGILVPIKDSAALAQAMLRLCEQPNLILEMGAASRQLAHEKYDVHKVNAIMLETLGL